MATSGSTDFNQTRDQIIRSALRKLGAISAGETPDNQTIQDCSEALNMMVKAWSAKGIHLWTESEGILFLQPNQIQYSLGPGSLDHCTQIQPPNFVQSSIASGAAQGATVLSLTTVTNILVGDHIGVTLDVGTVYWSTVTAVNPTAPFSVTIATGLPSSSGQTGTNNLVFDYTKDILRPLRIVDARLFTYARPGADALETPMFPMSRLDYRDLPNKTVTGTPTSFFYDPQLNRGIIYVWPAPPNANDAVKFTWYRMIEDFDTASNNPDLPTEWLSTLVWGLAIEMAPEYDCNPQRYQMLKAEFMEKFDTVISWDREPEPIYFGCSMDDNYSGGAGH